MCKNEQKIIPKVIHYCWFGEQPLPPLAEKCIESWKKYCPDYEIIQWNEENYKTDNKCSYVREAYEAKKWAFVSDYARLEIVYQYGGIYLDTDVELIKSLDDLLEQECFLALESSGYIATGLGFGAIKNSIALKMMLKEYENIHYKLGQGVYDDTPCPTRNTNPFKKMGLVVDSQIQQLQICNIYPPEYFCPLDYRTKTLKITSNTISIHHYNESWITEAEKRLTLEVREYEKTHGKIAVFFFKNKQEFEMKYPTKKSGDFWRFIVYKIKFKILRLRAKRY